MNLFKNIFKKDNLYNKNFLLKIISYYIFYILFYKKFILKNNNNDDNNDNDDKINQIFRKKNLDLFDSKKNILNKMEYKNSSKVNILDLPSINGITKEMLPIELELFNNIDSNVTKKPIIIYNYKEDVILFDNKNKFLQFSFNYRKDLFYKIEISFDLENVKNIIFICDNLTYNIFKNNIFIKNVSNIKLIIDNLSFNIEEEEKEITFYIVFYNKVILDQKNDILNNLSVINYKNIKLKNISIIIHEKVNILNDNLIFLLNINNNKYFPIYFDNLIDSVNSCMNSDMLGLPKEQMIPYKIENEKVYDANESYFM
jgi:hypothetical protein